ncbi:MAG: long-chain-fatty-acid--CoA ligase [Hyphomonadaceae bacterium]
MIELDGIECVADISRRQAKVRPQETALWFEGRDTSFADVDARSNRVANALLAADVQPGDRVAYLGKNMDVYYEIMFGTAKVRGALAAINNRLAAAEMQFIASDAKAKILFVAKEFYDIAGEIADELPELKGIIAIDGGHADWPSYTDVMGRFPDDDPQLDARGDDDVIQLYTSGTTGLPKGVMLTNDNYKAFMRQCAVLEWSSYGTGEAVMNAMPLFHVAGVNVGILAMAQGAETVIVREIDPMQILKLIPEKKVAHVFWVPAVILILTQIPNVEQTDFSSLKQVFYGASPITEDLLLEAQNLMGARFTQLYGLTETVGGATFLPPEAHNPAWGKLRSCGVPYPGTLIRCVDEHGQSVPTGDVGEIVIKSDFVMKGYWNRPEATEEAIRDGFFYTGDAGYFDEDGFLFIHDRVKDMIISGGENIYPAEVENAVFGHPDVADVAVIGVPDEKWGEAVKAIIVAKPDTNPDPEDIIAWTKERIASYKTPKSVDFIEEMPRNPSGKILRKDLREKYWQGVERRVG